MAKILAAKQLKGLLPICSYCKRIRGNGRQWEQLEDYITEHSEAEFSHGVCPECREKILEPKLTQLTRSRSVSHRRKETHAHSCTKCGAASDPCSPRGKKAIRAAKSGNGAGDAQKRGDR